MCRHRYLRVCGITYFIGRCYLKRSSIYERIWLVCNFLLWLTKVFPVQQILSNRLECMRTFDFDCALVRGRRGCHWGAFLSYMGCRLGTVITTISTFVYICAMWRHHYKVSSRLCIPLLEASEKYLPRHRSP